MIKDTEEGLKTKNANFHSGSFVLNLRGTDTNDLYDTMIEEVLEDFERFLRVTETGWRFYRVLDLQLHTVSYNPMRTSSYIPLPRELALKKAIINIKNKDNKCFSWCVLTALNPKDKDANIIDNNLKSKLNTLNMEGIEYPVSLKDIQKFEKQNPTISITVLGYEKSIYPLRNSNFTDRKNNITYF